MSSEPLKYEGSALEAGKSKITAFNAWQMDVSSRSSAKPERTSYLSTSHGKYAALSQFTCLLSLTSCVKCSLDARGLFSIVTCLRIAVCLDRGQFDSCGKVNNFYHCCVVQERDIQLNEKSYIFSWYSYMETVERYLYSNVYHDIFPPGLLSRYSVWGTGWITRNFFMALRPNVSCGHPHSWCF